MKVFVFAGLLALGTIPLCQASDTTQVTPVPVSHPTVVTQPFLTGSSAVPDAVSRPIAKRAPKVWRIRQVSGQGFSDSQSGHHGVLGTNSVFLSVRGEISGDTVTVNAIATAKGFGSDTVALTKAVHLRVTRDGHIIADQSDCVGIKQKAAVEAGARISVLDGDGSSKRAEVTFSAAAAYKMPIEKTSSGFQLTGGDGAGFAKTSSAVFEAVQE